MPKKQNKGKRSLSDQKNRRRPLAAPKKNPFETRKLKKKHIVVGQRLKSQESIGQARTQALEQRKKTLLVEYEQRDKVNAFIDKRIGEQDESLSHEEKMLIRYQKEKQKKLLKKSLFSLEDAEEGGLTHLGQSLSELDSFDDIVVCKIFLITFDHSLIHVYMISNDRSFFLLFRIQMMKKKWIVRSFLIIILVVEYFKK